MKKILFSLMAIALVVGLVGAGAFAFYDDTETSSGNTFTAGTLNLKVGNPDPTTWSYTIENIKPGQTGTIGPVDLVVEGTMSGVFDAKIVNVVDSPGDTTEPELEFGLDEGELGGCLLLTGLHCGDSYLGYGSPPATPSLNSAEGKCLYSGGLGGITMPPLTLTPDTYTFGIDWELPMDTGNVVQDDEVTFNIEFVLIQGDSGVYPK